MRERLACLMQKVIRKMIGKKEPSTFIEDSEKKKPVCLTEEKQMATSCYLISVT